MIWRFSAARACAVLFCFATAISSPLLNAQTLNLGNVNLATTPVPGSGHDYIKFLNETVNPANGSVSLRIEAPVPKQRGDVNFPYYVFGYDSGGVSQPTGTVIGGTFGSLHVNWTDNSGVSGGAIQLGFIPGGFVANSGVGKIFSQTTSLYTDLGSPYTTYTATCNYDTGFVYIDPSATRHSFQFIRVTMDGQEHSGTDAGCSYYNIFDTPSSSTSSHYQIALVGPAHQYGYAKFLTDSAGKGLGVEDTNGNCCGAIGQTTVSNNRVTSVAIPGIANSYSFTYGTATRNYSPASVLVTGDKCSTLSNDNTQKTVVSAITLPNNQQYQFQYDPTYALLKKVTYPTGAWVSYTWASQPMSESLGVGPYLGDFHCEYKHDWPYVQTRTVSFDGTTTALQQTFSYTTTWGTGSRWAQKTTTVTTKDLLRPGQPSYQTIYTYTGVPVKDFFTGEYQGETPIENSIVYKDYDGSILKTVTKNWTASDEPLLLSECTTLPNGLTSGVFYTYGPLDVVTDKKEYDYGIISSTACAQGASAPTATPTRETVVSYKSFATTPLFPTSSILDRPSTVKIYDNGTLLSETDYEYDVYTSGIGAVPSDTVGHDETNFPPSYTNRGNITKKTVKCLQSGCTDAVSRFGYDETGQVLSLVDPNGNTTNYDYTDSWASGDTYTSAITPSGHLNAYLTKITYPTTNGVSHIENFSYDYPSGQLTVAKDQNQRTTTYRYDDVFARLTKAVSPDGGQTTYAYTDAAQPQVTTTKLIAAGINSTATAVMDGMGHPIQTQASDPEGTDYVDSTYDGLGRLWKKSNPHRSTSSTTDGTTTFTYDGLGRTVSVTQPDPNSTVTSAYSSNCTTVTDEAGKVRESCADAFGRIVEVDEPGKGPDTIIPASPGGGSVTISGTLQGSGGTPSTGSVTISGAGQRKYICPSGPQSNQSSAMQPNSCIGGYYVYNSGSVSITVGTLTKSTNYTYGNTSSGIANALASYFNNDGNSPVTAQQSGSTINFTSKTTGTSTNYSLSTGCTYDSSNFSSCSFSGTRSGPTMTGGTNGTSDSGSTQITINGQQVPYSWSGSGTTASSIATGLANAINGTSSYATATASGTTVNLTARTTGAGTNYSLSTSTSSQYGSFSSSASGASFTGGADQQTIPGVWSLSTPYITYYKYDALDNLLCAAQKGTDPTPGTTCVGAPSAWRPRSFSYNSLSRLVTASNPESGTICYGVWSGSNCINGYDGNGNLISKTAPAPNVIPADSSSPQTVATTYTYDQLNRLTSKSYSDGTATVRYGYDGVSPTGCTYTIPTLSDSNPIGRRTSMCDESGATHWALDITGSGWRTTEARNIGGVIPPSNIVTQNNFGGMIYQLTYPTSRTVTYTPSTAARYLSAVDSASGINYAQNATYAPFGGLAGMTNGSAPITVTNSYNDRLQPTFLSAGTTTQGTIMSLGYDFHRGSGDSGNVYQVVNNLDNNRTKTYTYDGLNRISTGYTQATSGSKCWGQSFDIDAWGNLTNTTATKCSAPAPQTPANTQNQISGYCYSKAGNLLGTTACPTLPYTPTYVYDGENRLRTAAGVTYIYDGDGNRVKKSTGTLYWGAGPLAESDSSASASSWKEYIFFNGKRLARRDASNSTVHYYFSDHLGSTTVIANSSGTPEQDLDYYPYGGTAYGTAADHYLFTGKERDTETGLDYFGARYYGSNMGRWMSPDWAANATAVPYADFGDPQTLNLYGYVRNNPLFKPDLDGHGCPPDCVPDTVTVQQGIGLLKGIGNIGIDTTVTAIQVLTAAGNLLTGDSGIPEDNVPRYTYDNEIQAQGASFAPGVVAAAPELMEAGGGISSSLRGARGGEAADALGGTAAGTQAGDVGAAAGKGLGNPFKGKSAGEVDSMMKGKGMDPRGPDPAAGKGGYVNPKTGRSYHIDENNRFGEKPHVDVNRSKTYKGDLDKKKYPM